MSVQVPVPTLVTLPLLPLMAPTKVVEVLSPPPVSVPPPALPSGRLGTVSVPVAVAVTPLGGRAIVMVGIARYPLPPLVSVMLFTTLVTIAVAVAVTPLGGELKVIVGGDV